MARIFAYSWLFVIAPLHVGMAMTLIHPMLDKQEFFPVTVIGGFAWFGVVAFWFRGDSSERSWKWAGKRLLQFYVIPILGIAALQVGILAAEAGEFGRLWQECTPKGKEASSSFPKNAPPKSPRPGLLRMKGILAAWLWASAWFLRVLSEATPVWLWLFALVWGLIRYEK